MRLLSLTSLGSLRMHARLACLLLLAAAGNLGADPVRADVQAWLLAHNEGLKANFLVTELPGKTILLPDGRTIPIYQTKQFLDVNFRLTFFARKKEKGSDIVSVMEERLRKLLARPEFYDRVKTHKPEYRISPKGKVSSQEAYDHFRHIHRNLGVTAGKQFHAPVGGGSGIAAPSWAVWKKMNLFFHEACHCIGIGHNSGGLSGPIAGSMETWNRKGLWKYETIDLNALTIPAPAAGAANGAPAQAPGAPPKADEQKAADKPDADDGAADPGADDTEDADEGGAGDAAGGR
jgi:hypothetical protein